MGAPFAELWHLAGPALSGGLFAAGWWVWLDAAVCSKVLVAFVHYLPGIMATFAALMLNSVRREEVQEYSPYDDEAACSLRMWLFVSYVLCFVSVAAAIGMLINDAAVKPADPSKAIGTWPGLAGVLQCLFLLTSGMVFWTSRSSD